MADKRGTGGNGNRTQSNPGIKTGKANTTTNAGSKTAQVSTAGSKAPINTSSVPQQAYGNNQSRLPSSAEIANNKNALYTPEFNHFLEIQKAKKVAAEEREKEWNTHNAKWEKRNEGAKKTEKAVGTAVGTVLTATTTAISSLKNEARKQDGFAEKAVAGGLQTSAIAIQTFQLSQKITPAVIKVTGDVGKTAYLTAKSAATAIDYANRTFTPVKSQLTKNVFLRNAWTSGLTQTGTSKVIKTGYAVASKGYDVLTTAGKFTITVSRTAGSMIAMRKFVPFTPKFAKDTFKLFAQQTGLVKTATSRNIIRTANRIQSRIGSLSGLSRRQIAGRVARGLGTEAGRAAGKGLKLGGKGLWAGTKFTLKKGIPFGLKAAGKGIGLAGRAIGSSDDYMLRGISTSIQTARTGVRGIRTTAKAVKLTGKTIKTSGKVLKTTGKGIVKAGKGVVRGIQYIAKHGWKNAFRTGIRKAGKGIGSAVVKAGGSVANLLIDLVQAGAKKVAAPLILVVIAGAAVSNIITAPVAGVGAMFSGIFETFSGYGYPEEISVDEFFDDPENGIAAQRQSTVDSIWNQARLKMKENGGQYHIVRIKDDSGNRVKRASRENVDLVFYPAEVLHSAFKPIFHAKVVGEYEMRIGLPTAKNVLLGLFNQVFYVEFTDSNEYCGQLIDSGEGEANPVHEECGNRHANEDCPNAKTGYHTSFTCSACDSVSYTCNGHAGAVNCGISRHTHGTSCGTLKCRKHLTDSTHRHTEYCYSYNCGKWEHRHTTDCWFYAGGKPIYVNCGKAEHTHKNACYTCEIPIHNHVAWRSPENPGCFATFYHSQANISQCADKTQRFVCTGYRYCKGHKVTTMHIDINEITKLEDKVFKQPIEQLERMENRDDEDEEKLENLKFAYELYLIFLEEESKVFYGSSGLMTPTRFIALTSPFGMRYHPVLNQWRMHRGVDLGAPMNTPIYASADGVVTYTGYQADGAGNYVTIDHTGESEGYRTRYFHMTRYIVSVGQEVEQGELIGYVGHTGIHTGDHLHFEVWINGENVDPELYVDFSWRPGDPPKNEPQEEDPENAE